MRSFLSGCLVAVACCGQLTAQDAVYRGKTVKEWTATLKHADPRMRYLALSALSEAGADAAPAVKDIARLLRDPQTVLRRGAASVLGGLGEAAAPVAAHLGHAARDNDAGVRDLAADALNGLGDKAVPPLLEALADKEPTVRLAALTALEVREDAGAEVIKAVGKAATRDAKVGVRKAALVIFSKVAPGNAEVMTFLTEALRDSDASIRVGVAQILLSAGKDSIEPFGKVADDANPSLRLLAVQALFALAEDLDDKGILTLRKALSDRDARVRFAATASMARLGTRAREFGGGKDLYLDLAKLLQDKTLYVRRAAAQAMGVVGIDEKEELALLAQGLKDRDIFVRGLTVQALTQYATEESPDEVHVQIIGHLLEALRDTDRRVVYMAAEVLIQEGGRSVRPLIGVVEKGQGKERIWAALVLAEMGAPAAAAVPALEKMSKEATPETRRIAQAVLQRIRN